MRYHIIRHYACGSRFEIFTLTWIYKKDLTLHVHYIFTCARKKELLIVDISICNTVFLDYYWKCQCLCEIMDQMKYFIQLSKYIYWIMHWCVRQKFIAASRQLCVPFTCWLSAQCNQLKLVVIDLHQQTIRLVLY